MAKSKQADTPRGRPRLVALAVVGPIASGKSYVLDVLGELGAATCSADEIARQLTAPGQPALEQIYAEFGQEYQREDGSLDRQKLAELIFADASAREHLEDILHPVILDRIGAWVRSLRAKGTPPPVAAVEVLRLPRHLRARERFDVVWLCEAPAEIRIQRLMQRDSLSLRQAQARIEVQRTQAVEDCEPDLILNTGGSKQSVREQVIKAWARLTRSALRT